MREIKYQAWDTKDKRMISWRELLDYGSGLAEYLASPRELIFREFTGLKDRKGKELYEGDIFQHISDTGILSELSFQIVFYEGCFSYAWSDGGVVTNLKKLITDYIVVIGNIYENQELVNTK